MPKVFVAFYKGTVSFIRNLLDPSGSLKDWKFRFDPETSQISCSNSSVVEPFQFFLFRNC